EFIARMPRSSPSHASLPLDAAAAGKEPAAAGGPPPAVKKWSPSSPRSSPLAKLGCPSREAPPPP
ncbi:hypothetical protein Dimus_025612, partial [Dionaea muscipula]